MCDCPRSKGKEYYWNGYSCQQTRLFGETCSNAASSYMCQTLTQGTICADNGTGIFSCKCMSTLYFDSTTNACANPLTFNKPCLFDQMCSTSAGLICINGQCRYKTIKIIFIRNLFKKIPCVDYSCSNSFIWSGTKCGKYFIGKYS